MDTAMKVYVCTIYEGTHIASKFPIRDMVNYGQIELTDEEWKQLDMLQDAWCIWQTELLARIPDTK